MSSPEEVLQRIQKVLHPYIRPREEVAQIRRILALQLDSCLENGSATSPLALVDASKPKSSPTVRGLRREYLEALSANIKARSEHKACCLEISRPQAEASTAVEQQQQQQQKSDRLHDHLATIGLQKKQEKLQAIEKHLNLIRQKPVASADYLAPEQIFSNCRPLPDVPKELLSALTLDKTATSSRLKDLADQLEKHVLRAKLLLKREEQLLDQVKSRSTVRPENISTSAKFGALNTTRAHLINWIEAELGKAGDGAGEDGDATDDFAEPFKASGDGADAAASIEENLAIIQQKYSQYLGARKALLQLVSQQPRPVIKPRAEPSTAPAAASTSTPPPYAHLLSPYLEQLVSVAQEQKGLIAQKSHLNSTVARQLVESCQALDRLAEESQLIPSHPLPGASVGGVGAPRRKQTFGDALGAAAAAASQALSLSGSVKPWVFAAESAKIATLEAVAEKIEEGQLALEDSIHTIGEIDQLLGRHPVRQTGQESEDAVAAEDDIWLAESRPSGMSAGASRKHVSRKEATATAVAAAKRRSSGDVWDTLDGTLGLLRSDGDPP
ncbi:hypothetical protein B0T26DRAFT_736696 [Lasiosphaeria miniovina]|uniref:Uncharacterized protein n=1 Tax=Lasiosphaeria miniovina TaxID=1954250 RepID=A0AA40EDW7_9PEZI|nr:uncharacterized protein B0T26DRAFT_736696 [Lasiosphaeria miniovina]KAK0733881.1 hypothetical protein B0T26DRAFT_736696 [Lasiosphaeria miniovina]